MASKLVVVFVCIALVLTLQINAQDAAKKPRRNKSKSKGSPVTCPDTCALKRRIGKVETWFQEDIAEVKSACLGEVNVLRSEILEGNFTFPTNSSGPVFNTSALNDMNENLTSSLKRQISDAVNNLKTEFFEGQNKMDEAFERIRELASSMSYAGPDDELRESRQRELDLRTTIDLMNSTLHTLQSQNLNLQRQTQAVRAQSSVLRAQNDVLSEDNMELRQTNSQSNKLSEGDEDRLNDIEDLLALQVSSISSLEQQVEWLSERIKTLATGVDSAAFEAASALKSAARAEEIAKRALRAAKGRPEVEPEPEVVKPTGVTQPDVPPTDCWELYQMGYNKSGIYKIKPWHSSQIFEVFCEQSYNGGGWTMIQKRRDGSVDFDRDWNEYAEGFGDLDGEMWLGNDKIHAITNQDTYILQVLLLDWDENRAYAEYEGFRVHSNVDYYSLRFGRFTRGTAGDGFRGTIDDGSRNLYLARFTTTDIDNDSCRPCMDGSSPFENCASLQGGGWWFRACADSNLNGRYIHQRDFRNCRDGCYGIQWRTWRSDANYSLKASIMLVKPVTSSNP